jgi:hypothetical protein
MQFMQGISYSHYKMLNKKHVLELTFNNDYMIICYLGSDSMYMEAAEPRVNSYAKRSQEGSVVG